MCFDYDKDLLLKVVLQAYMWKHMHGSSICVCVWGWGGNMNQDYSGDQTPADLSFQIETEELLTKIW